MIINSIKKFIISYKYIIFGFLLCIPFWIMEGTLHIFFFCTESTTFLQALFACSPHELWMRTVGVIFIILFGVIAHYFNKSRDKLNLVLGEKNRFINSIFYSIQDGISVLDLDLNIIQANHWMEKMYNKHYPLVGKKCYLVHQERTSICPWCPSIKTINTGEMHSEIVPYNGDSGKKGWIYVTAFPMKDKNNNVTGVIEHLKDITELKEIEKNFRDAYNKAEFYKDLFAHDINNILQTILSSTELSKIYLKKPNSEKELSEFLSIIQTQVLRGSKLILNIRKLSMLEKTNKTIQRIDAIKILTKCIEGIRESQLTKKVNVNMEIINEEEIVLANELLYDIFENILNNAVTHNINSVIEISVKTSKVTQSEINYLKLEFIDNGIGVETLSKDQIFNRSYQEKDNYNNNNNNNNNGLGMGLSLVKKIVESYNGHIWVENRIPDDYSKGSVFVMLIPTEDNNLQI